MNQMVSIAPVAWLLLCAASTAAIAQGQPPTTIDPRACAPGERLEQGERGPEAPSTAGQNLSDKLARTEGVLCPPPNIDSEIQAPTPDVGKTPVIPPPGSPGGDPDVRPK
jgi:hypothetical protein